MKKHETAPKWVATLRTLMEGRGYNPRSLSLKAGLNATAVRDILEGRAKYPRYDTVQALSKALEVRPDDLMNGDNQKITDKKIAKLTNKVKPTTQTITESETEDDDLELLTEIISKLQEAADEYKQKLKPQSFAAMITTIYKHTTPPSDKGQKGISPNTIKQLMIYERLRNKTGTKG